MNKLAIDKETKIVLLTALKNGYIDLNDLEKIEKKVCNGYTDDELNDRIKELSKRLGLNPPFEIEIIDRTEQVADYSLLTEEELEIYNSLQKKVLKNS